MITSTKWMVLPAVALCVAFLAIPEQTDVRAACAFQKCVDTCKVHNRWCITAGGVTKTRRYATNVSAGAGWCAQVASGVTPIELDTISRDIYPGCNKDCPNDAQCTGTQDGSAEIEKTESVPVNTLCSAK